MRRAVLGLVAVVLLALALAVGIRSGAFTSVIVESMARQVGREQKAFAIRSNASRKELAAMVDHFTQGKPVEVLRLTSDGAIVANSRGEEWLLSPGSESPTVGELRWVTLGDDVAEIGAIATP